jgi:glyoxylase-like metal-dependent hydrolase (beta-lactamase superfamily II)
MARVQQRLAANAAGPFYVDRSCIDCGTCWQFDPAHFAPTGDTSCVHHQPQGEAELRQALLAHTPADGFPALVDSRPEGDVYYCGWASRKSFGASSWLILRRRDDGSANNVLIDSPRWSAALARQIAALGGLQRILLSHRDDVADHAAWARHFGCERWIHAADASAAPEAEHQLEGTEPVALDAELQLIPTPGHTPGSLVVLFAGQVLFSGDHLWWGVDPPGVVASRRYCWWNWEEQLRSVEKLLDLDVRWLLPGHGRRKAFGPGEWRGELERTLAGARGA